MRSSMIRETGMKLPYAAHECSASTTAPRDTSAYTSAIAYLRTRTRTKTHEIPPVSQPTSQPTPLLYQPLVLARRETADRSMCVVCVMWRRYTSE